MKHFSDIHSRPQLGRKQPLAFVHIRHLLTYYYSAKSRGKIIIKSSVAFICQTRARLCLPCCSCASAEAAGERQRRDLPAEWAPSGALLFRFGLKLTALEGARAALQAKWQRVPVLLSSFSF